MSITGQMCLRHDEVEATATCRHCGTPMCPECQKNLGEFCSTECFNQVHVPAKSASQKTHQASADMRGMMNAIGMVMKLTGVAFVLAIIVTIVICVWVYKLRPYGKPLWQITVNGPGHSHFVDYQDDLAIAKIGSKLICFEPGTGAELWRLDTGQPRWERLIKEDDYFLLMRTGQIIKVTRKGELVWTLNYSAETQTLLSDKDNALVFAKGQYVRPSDQRRWMEDMKYVPDSRNYYSDSILSGGPEPKTHWINEGLVVYSKTTGQELWSMPLKRETDLLNIASNDKVAVATISNMIGLPDKKVGYDLRYLFIVISMDSENLPSKERVLAVANLPGYPEQGPVIAHDQALLTINQTTYAYSLQGNLIATKNGESLTDLNLLNQKVDKSIFFDPNEGLRMRRGSFGISMLSGMLGGDDIHELGRPTEMGYKDPTIFYDGYKIQYSEINQKGWHYELPGGITSYTSVGNMVVVTGYSTREGGQAKEMGQAFNQMLGNDAMSGIMAASVATGDQLLVGIDKNTGEPIWQLDQMAGQLVSDGGKVILLNDTKRTSALTSASGARGELKIIQINPKKGKKMWSWTHKDLAVREPFIHNGHLVGLSYDREKNSENPDLKGNPTGIISIRLK